VSCYELFERPSLRVRAARFDIVMTFFFENNAVSKIFVFTALHGMQTQCTLYM